MPLTRRQKSKLNTYKLKSGDEESENDDVDMTDKSKKNGTNDLIDEGKDESTSPEEDESEYNENEEEEEEEEEDDNDDDNSDEDSEEEEEESPVVVVRRSKRGRFTRKSNSASSSGSGSGSGSKSRSSSTSDNEDLYTRRSTRHLGKQRQNYNEADMYKKMLKDDSVNTNYHSSTGSDISHNNKRRRIMTSTDLDIDMIMGSDASNYSDEKPKSFREQIARKSRRNGKRIYRNISLKNTLSKGKNKKNKNNSVDNDYMVSTSSNDDDDDDDSDSDYSDSDNSDEQFNVENVYTYVDWLYNLNEDHKIRYAIRKSRFTDATIKKNKI